MLFTRKPETLSLLLPESLDHFNKVSIFNITCKRALRVLFALSKNKRDDMTTSLPAGIVNITYNPPEEERASQGKQAFGDARLLVSLLR